MVLRIIAFIPKLRAMSVFTRVFDALWRASKGSGHCKGNCKHPIQRSATEPHGFDCGGEFARENFRMRKSLLLAVIVCAAIRVSAAAAQPTVYCAVPPVAPAGCPTEKARCICDTKSRCQWYYDCTGGKSAAAGSAYLYPDMMQMDRDNATPRPTPGSRY